MYAQTYIPPLGIPAPEFGINEQVTDFYVRPSPEYYTNPSPLDEEIEGWYYIGRNTAYANRQSPIGIKQSRGVIISENRLYNNRIVQSNATAQSGIVFQYGPERLWIINNRIYNSDVGITAGGNSGGNLEADPLFRSVVIDCFLKPTIVVSDF